MLTYDELKDRPREFLAVTGLTLAEFAQLLPAFQTAYAQRIPAHLTVEGKERQRRPGAGSKGILSRPEDRLLFILVYLKTNPLQVSQGLQFGLSQAQTNYWIHCLLPVLRVALADLHMLPTRDGTQVAAHLRTTESTLELAIDGTERRRQRPQDAEAQRRHYSGKKKTHTDKNIVLIDEATGRIIYLGPTEAGSKHDKKAADEAAIIYPEQATLDQDAGFQGYAPAHVVAHQPKKSAWPGVQCRRQVPESDRGQCAHRSRTRDLWHQTLSDRERGVAPDQMRHFRSHHGNRLWLAQLAHILSAPFARL
jgi:hypothetical protein